MLYKKLILDNLNCTKPVVSVHGIDYTYKKLNNLVIEFQDYLKQHNVSEGQFVIITNDNSIQTITAILTCISMHVCFVIIPEESTEEHLNYIVSDVMPKAHFIPKSDGSIEIRDFCFDVYGKQDSLIYVIYTSGSTGKPKGVMAPELQVEFCIDAINDRLNNGFDDRILCCLPLSFDYGLYQLFMALRFQATIVIPRNNTITEIPKILVQERITGFPAMPSLLRGIVYSRMLERLKPEKLRYVTSTGDNFPVELIRRIMSLLPHIEIIPMYGQTECKRVSVMPTGYNDKVLAGSCGLPLKGTKVWLENKDADGVGELIVSGPNVMQGYLNDDKTTAEYYFEHALYGRCLRTGDLFTIDEEGFLYFQSRKKRLLKVSGHRIGCLEMEELFEKAISEFVFREIRVVGLQDPLYGEKAVLCISTSEISDQIIESISSVNEKLDVYHRISRVYLTDQPFPKSANGKIDDICLITEIRKNGTLTI